MELKKLLGNNWAEVLSPKLNLFRFNSIDKEISLHFTELCPKASSIFKAFKQTTYDNVRVVILGNEPYNNGHADGLAYSVSTNTPIPSVLHKIFKEAGVTKQSGDLKNWAEQGVFLYNITLTSLKGNSGRHKNAGWAPFSKAVLEALNEHPQDLVFMLWGKQAIGMQEYITSPRHLILTASHPNSVVAVGVESFTGCNHFNKANVFLGEREVQW